MAFQSVTPIRLAQAAVTVDYLAIFTGPTNSRTYVKDIDICNTSSSARRIYISLVPDQEVVGVNNAIFYNALIPAYTTVQWTGAQILNAGDTVQAKADAVGVTVTITGGEATE
jgi:hypothetical protein